jgi:GT2 family glycosyltransferase
MKHTHGRIESSHVPEVSVVTLNWNGLQHLNPCYEALRELDYPHDKLELILVDNGSTDGSIEFMRSHFPQVRLIENGTNVGFARANNIGTRQARGQYVAFLNNDTRVDAAWLNELVAAVESDSDIACAASKMLTWAGDRIDFGGGTINFHGVGFHPNRGEPASTGTELRELLFACGGSMLIDRQVFLDAGGFDEDFFIYSEDVDLGWRLWVLGHRVVFAPKAITYHRLHGDTGGMQNEKRVAITERNTLLAAIKNYEEENLARVLPAALLLMLERAYLLAGIDSQRYKLDPHQTCDALPGELGTAGAGLSSRQTKGVGSAWQAGFWQGVRRAFRKAWRRGCQQFILRFNHQLEAVPRPSLGPLVAAHDVLQLLPCILEKRSDIQRRRKRSDAEILPLFGEPFHPALETDRYTESQSRISQLLGIQQMFDNENAS